MRLMHLYSEIESTGILWDYWGTVQGGNSLRV